MAVLRIENVETTDRFLTRLSALNVSLPLHISETETGVILDAAGREVITVDVNGERPDNQVHEIALWIAMAVNTCGGFKAARKDG